MNRPRLLVFLQANLTGQLDLHPSAMSVDYARSRNIHDNLIASSKNTWRRTVSSIRGFPIANR